jgi:hypothetical protein
MISITDSRRLQFASIASDAAVRRITDRRNGFHRLRVAAPPVFLRSTQLFAGSLMFR